MGGPVCDAMQKGGKVPNVGVQRVRSLWFRRRPPAEVDGAAEVSIEYLDGFDLIGGNQAANRNLGQQGATESFAYAAGQRANVLYDHSGLRRVGKVPQMVIVHFSKSATLLRNDELLTLQGFQRHTFGVGQGMARGDDDHECVLRDDCGLQAKSLGWPTEGDACIQPARSH